VIELLLPLPPLLLLPLVLPSLLLVASRLRPESRLILRALAHQFRRASGAKCQSFGDIAWNLRPNSQPRKESKLSAKPPLPEPSSEVRIAPPLTQFLHALAALMMFGEQGLAD
jgi:hypothetical protein